MYEFVTFATIDTCCSIIITKICLLTNTINKNDEIGLISNDGKMKSIKYIKSIISYMLILILLLF